MLAPRRAPPRDGDAPSLPEPEAGWLNGTGEDAGAGEGETVGGSATLCCLDHIRDLPYRISKMKFAPGGKEQCGNHVVPRRGMEQQRNKADLRSWKTGREDRRRERDRRTERRLCGNASCSCARPTRNGMPGRPSANSRNVRARK